MDNTGIISNPILKSGGGELSSYTGKAFIQAVLPAIITFALIVGAIFFVFMLITGAIQWISSGGDKGGLEAAKSKITNALIGIVILFSFFAIGSLIGNFFGVDIMAIQFFSILGTN